MNRVSTDRSEEEHARIDTEIGRILAGEEALIPSSGFVGAVMERVRQEAALPAPLPFPWKRAIPLLLLVCVSIGGSTVELVRIGMQGFDLTAPSQSAQSWLTTFPPHLSGNLVQPIEQAGWVALALGVSLLCWLFSRRLAGRGGLL